MSVRFTSILTIAFTLLTALTPTKAFAQKTITYKPSGLSTQLCNVFNIPTPAKINDVAHYPVAGGAKFNGNSVILESKIGNTLAQNLGTAYALEYPFRVGLKYIISVNALRTSEDPTSNPRLSFSAFTELPAPDDTNPTVCGSVGEDYWAVLQNNIVGFSYINATAKTYTFPEWAPAEDADYLIVLATQGSPSKTTQVLINQISITEVVPPAFSLAPSSVARTCGDTTAQTFTVTNLEGIRDIRAYEWDLGSASNGWSYQGAPAPATLTTTDAILTLTPICGAAQEDISVAVKTGSSSYGPYQSDVTNPGYPSMSIQGPSILCTTAPHEYRLLGLPCSTSVIWSTSDVTLATAASRSDNTGTLTKGTNFGDITLTAQVSGNCGATTLTKKVRVGPYWLTRPYGTLTFETNASTYKTVELVTVTDFYGWTYGTNGLLLRASVTQPEISGYWQPNEPTGPNAEILSFQTTDTGKTALVRFNPFASGDKVASIGFHYSDGCGQGGTYSHWFHYKGSSGFTPTESSPNEKP
ncbi:hypothetical protein [Myxococcus sp. CA039A]|uniref:hypothetical protein n=1 Tax=Myxococcus sp. CA039A TaxID=2741737 RepID=UPI00157A22EB|nr:hypothetical protein [Myxococcus sp. CA039A]NTX53688.1 hypothetical protein [Myxococcus sp. CA039A]